MKKILPLVAWLGLCVSLNGQDALSSIGGFIGGAARGRGGQEPITAEFHAHLTGSQGAAETFVIFDQLLAAIVKVDTDDGNGVVIRKPSLTFPIVRGQVEEVLSPTEFLIVSPQGIISKIKTLIPHDWVDQQQVAVRGSPLENFTYVNTLGGKSTVKNYQEVAEEKDLTQDQFVAALKAGQIFEITISETMPVATPVVASPETTPPTSRGGAGFGASLGRSQAPRINPNDPIAVANAQIDAQNAVMRAQTYQAENAPPAPPPVSTRGRGRGAPPVKVEYTVTW